MIIFPAIGAWGAFIVWVIVRLEIVVGIAMTETPIRVRTVMFVLFASLFIGASVLPMAFVTARAIGLW